MSTRMIRVFLEGCEREHQAAGWVVDEQGHLHVTAEKGAGNVATYRAGTWESVRVVDGDAWEPEAVGRMVADAIKMSAARARSMPGRSAR
jgi:hypothetical protein